VQLLGGRRIFIIEGAESGWGYLLKRFDNRFDKGIEGSGSRSYHEGCSRCGVNLQKGENQITRHL